MRFIIVTTKSKHYYNNIIACTKALNNLIEQGEANTIIDIKTGTNINMCVCSKCLQTKNFNMQFKQILTIKPTICDSCLQETTDEMFELSK